MMTTPVCILGALSAFAMMHTIFAVFSHFHTSWEGSHHSNFSYALANQPEQRSASLDSKKHESEQTFAQSLTLREG
jgi:hypothetical protein